MNGDLEAQFRQALLDAYRAAVEGCNYRGNYALWMVNELGPVEAARRLINATQPAEGFTKLWECGRLDLTVEAIALREEFQPQFEGEELERARERLRQHGYDPEAEEGTA